MLDPVGLREATFELPNRFAPDERTRLDHAGYCCVKLRSMRRVLGGEIDKRHSHGSLRKRTNKPRRVARVDAWFLNVPGHH